MKKKQGAPTGNKNATKGQPKKMWAHRLPIETIALIKSRSTELGISQAKYVQMLVGVDKED